MVPFYDTPERLLERALLSAVRQSGDVQHEIVICDDGSSAPAAAALDRLVTSLRTRSTVPIKVQTHAQRLGPASARNTAVQYAEGDYLLWLDSDDELHPDAVHVLLDEARTRDVSMVLSRCKVIDVDSRVAVRDSGPLLADARDKVGTPDDPLAQVVFSIQAQLVARTAFHKVNGFDPTYEWAEVTDFFLRFVSTFGLDAVHHVAFDGYVYHRRRGSHSLSNRVAVENHRRSALLTYARTQLRHTHDVVSIKPLGPARTGEQYFVLEVLPLPAQNDGRGRLA